MARLKAAEAALLCAALSLGGCSAGAARMVPSPIVASLLTHGRAASDSATAMPGDSATAMPGDAATAMPGDAATAMPGDAATAMPGDAATAMPGASFACGSMSAPGTASCTLAINLNVAPLANPQTPAAMIAGLHPSDLQSAYALPSGGAGGVVAVVDAFDAPSAEADLAVYRAAFGLSPCTSANGCFRKVNERGSADTFPAADAGWAQEIALDLEMVSATCPSCSILLVEADSGLIDDLGASVDTAARLGARAISNSYYSHEWSGESAEDVHYRHPGIAITASSGDRGFSSYPAASQYVTSVGGTSLRGGSGGWTQQAWAYSGHGCSPYVARPAWQTAASCGHGRSTVDVAAIADPQTGVSMYASLSGGWLVAGGTSVSAPIVAAAYALSGNPASPAYSYAHRSAFRPVGNGSYSLVTGLGTPIGTAGL
ncbi:MAG: peptidase S8 [Candidatus Eremiobacteraeota bacterium]|nr:peptidase S8 [Candidatus Eremiobacteraeota bacterium]